MSRVLEDASYSDTGLINATCKEDALPCQADYHGNAPPRQDACGSLSSVSQDLRTTVLSGMVTESLCDFCRLSITSARS